MLVCHLSGRRFRTESVADQVAEVVANVAREVIGEDPGSPGAHSADRTVDDDPDVPFPGVCRHSRQAGVVPDEPMISRSDGTRLYGRTVDPATGVRLRLGPADLTFLRIDHQTRLQFEGIEVVIEEPFDLTVGTASHHLEPGERGGLGPLLALYPDRLEDASVDADGSLHLAFTSGARITVRPNAQFEAWQVSGPENYLVVCTPGGAIAVWS
jgi:hypothetical protein